jgi:sugar phosphate isomerase/epimerase
MTAKEPGDTGADCIEKCAAAGFEYLEMPLAEISLLDGGRFGALVRRVEASGLRCEACNNFFPRELRLTGPDADMGAISEYIKEMLARAGMLGIEILVFGSGPAKTVPNGYSVAEAYKQVAEITRIAAAEAEQYGITIVVEPLRRAECNIINSYREACGLVRDVNLHNVKALVDYYHLAEESEPPAHIAEDGALLRHAHFARRKGRTYPHKIEEEATYGPFIDALVSAGYEGRISLEAYTDDFDAEAPRALAFMRRYFT